MVYNKNNYLTKDEMTVNGQYIVDYLLSKGWHYESVCAMLGNMETESTINPGIWQGLESYADRPYDTVPGHGFGLVQWTPFDKYTDWARDSGLPYDNIDSELQRILYEVANGIQWIPNGHEARYGLSPAYDITFEEFINNTNGYSVEELADAFLWNYEGPADPDQPNRATQARYWYDNLTTNGQPPGGDNGGGDQTPDDSDLSTLIHFYLGGTLTGWQ